MDMAEFDAQNQIVSGEASPLLLPRCILTRPIQDHKV